jgi:hypothetical protein
VGAVFFILIVVLMVGALAAMFGTFNSFIDGQHVSNANTEQAQQTSLNVQNVTYGGLTSYNGFNYAANGALNLVANTKQHPLLPITNMNFTGNMQGWTTSHTYQLVTDAATVQLSPQEITYNSTFPSSPLHPLPAFVLTVFNNNLGGSQYEIAKVSLLVDTHWAVSSPQPVTLNWGATPLATSPPSVVGNNITWVSNLPFDIGAGCGCNQIFTWTPTVPQSYGTFYDTVVVSWVKNNLTPFTDTGIATVNSTVTQTEVSFSGTLGTSSAPINPAPAGAASSGLIAGYDANALTTTSESGPGSMYLDFKPSFNSAPITDGQQLTATADFTTAFSLDYKTVNNIVTAGCCTLTWESSLDSVNAQRDSLITYQAYLTGPPIPISTGTTTGGTSPTVLQDTAGGWAAGAWVGDYLLYTSGPAVGESQIITANSVTSITTAAFIPAPTATGGDAFMITIHPKGLTYELPVGGTSCGASPNPDDYVNPTTVNDFGPTGWVLGKVCFNPSTGNPAWLNGSIWYTGAYALTIAVTITVPGAIPQTAGYPPEVSIHLDDIGLAFKQVAATTYYGTTTFQIPTGLNTNQVQGLEVGINATGTNQNTTMYAYIIDNSHFVYNPPNWVQIGSASFINSAVIDSVSPLPNAAYYDNSTAYLQGGKAEVGDLTIRVNATSSVATAPYSVQLAVWAVIQTFNQTRLTVELQNQSPAPIRLLSMVITGPGSALSYTFATNYYFGPGQKLVMPETFAWIPGSTYTVTVTTASGLTFSRSFPAPLA